ncbi:MAG: formyltransferase family protein [Flavobacteriales bacterium]
MKIGVVSGSKNCLPLLQFFKANQIVADVFTDEIKPPEGDFEFVRHYCQSVNIEIEESIPFHEWCLAKQPEIIFVFGYGKLINTRLIGAELSSKLFNIHFAALPDFKGPAPLFWQIKSGISEMSLCIHHINEKFDDGMVVWRKNVPYEAHYSYGFLELLFSQLVLEGVVQILQHYLHKTKMPAIENKQGAAKYYARPQLKDVKINWKEMSAAEITRLVNACNPWNKGAFTSYNGNEVKIIDIEILPSAQSHPSVATGTIINHVDCLQVQCSNAVLNLNMININGNFMPARYASKMGFMQGTAFDN